METILIIGHNFPEPSTTAAGARMEQLIGLFKENQKKVVFASTATVSRRSLDLKNFGVDVRHIELNNASFDSFVRELSPDIVLYDRYITEEQFGWRVYENCPSALRILDTEDLHFLRKAREEAVKKGKSISEADLFTDMAKRELASILRCDLSLIISSYEMHLLQSLFKIPSSIIFYLPFLVEPEDNDKIGSFDQRKDFVTIGNLLHQPNVDAVLHLKRLWPAIRKQVKGSALHIYGDYAPEQVLQLHNEKEGFLIKGWASSLNVITEAKLLLAPLRFGAGLKGKLVEAMCFGTPWVSTEIGAEGLTIDGFEESIAENDEDFIKKSVALYSHQELWSEMQEKGLSLIRQEFNKELFTASFNEKIHLLQENLERHRKDNFLGQILNYKTLQSTKYMSKWIEAKNTSPQNASPVCFASSDEVRDEYK